MKNKKAFKQIFSPERDKSGKKLKDDPIKSVFIIIGVMLATILIFIYIFG